MNNTARTIRRSSSPLALTFALLFSAGLSAEDPGLAPGEKAPDFKLQNQEGREIRLGDLLKKSHVALVFYRSADW